MCRTHIYYRDHTHAHWIQLQAHPNTKAFLTTSTHRPSQPHTSPKGMCCCQTVRSSFPCSFSFSVLSLTAWRLDFPRSWAASIHTPVKDLREQSKLSMGTHAGYTQARNSLCLTAAQGTQISSWSVSRDWCNPVTSMNFNSSEYEVSRISYGTPSVNKSTLRLTTTKNNLSFGKPDHFVRTLRI